MLKTPFFLPHFIQNLMLVRFDHVTFTLFSNKQHVTVYWLKTPILLLPQSHGMVIDEVEKAYGLHLLHLALGNQTVKCSCPVLNSSETHIKPKK